MSEKKMLGVHTIGAIPDMYGMTKTGMRPVVKYKLDRGVHVYNSCFAMNTYDFVVVDDKMNAVMLDQSDQDWTREPTLDDRGMICDLTMHRITIDHCKPISDQYGIGYYFADDEDLISEEVIERSLQMAKFMDKLVALVEEDKQREDREDHARCERNYSYLTRVDKFDNHYSREYRVAISNNIKTELKKHFPTTKFHVRYSSFSGGDSYDIDWTDGPITKEVDNVVKKFQNGQPDEYSMGDYWDSVHTNFTRMYGSAKYVMTQRDISDEAISSAKIKLLEQHPDLTDENVLNYPLSFNTCGQVYHTVEDAARSYAYDLDFQTKHQEKEVVSGMVCDNLQIIDYSEKAIAVVGDTKEVKDTLKQLGGRFNRNLSVGSGWVFPKTKMNEIKSALGL